jgi:uncharacterized membrane protein
MTANERSTNPSLFFTKEEIVRISEAIFAAEKNTQGEILVHLERKCSVDPIERSRVLMKELKLDDTKNRSGLLIYIAIEDHKFAIFGDDGIHKILGQEGWNVFVQELGEYFKRSEFVEGLISIIAKIGVILTKFFPAVGENIDEIPNQPTFGED